MSLNRLSSRAQPCPPAKGRTGQTWSLKKYLFTSPDQVTQTVKMWKGNSQRKQVYHLGPQKPSPEPTAGSAYFNLLNLIWLPEGPHSVQGPEHTIHHLMINYQFERDQQSFLKNILSITSGGHPFTEGSLSRFKKKVKATVWKDLLSPRHC